MQMHSKIVHKFIGILCILGLAGTLVFADGKTTVVIVDSNGKASFGITDLSESDSALVFEKSDPYGKNTLILDDNGDAHWTDKSLSELNKKYNNKNGKPPINIVWGEGEVIDLFEKGVSGHIIPENGTWKSRMLTNKIKGCPPSIRGRLKESSAYSTTKTIKFSKPFTPNDVFDPKDINPNGNQDIKWKKTKANTWEVTPFSNTKGMKLEISWKLKVTSKTTMDISSHFSMKFPKGMAMIMGGSSECSVYSTGILERIKN